jgi:hypothetical protein
MKPEDITDEQVKEALLERTFNQQSVLDVFASLSTNAYIHYAHQVAKEKVNNTWENITGSQIDELKAQMVAESKEQKDTDES